MDERAIVSLDNGAYWVESELLGEHDALASDDDDAPWPLTPPQPLSYRPFQRLLELFVVRAGRVLRRAQLTSGAHT